MSIGQHVRDSWSNWVTAAVLLATLQAGCNQAPLPVASPAPAVERPAEDIPESVAAAAPETPPPTTTTHQSAGPSESTAPLAGPAADATPPPSAAAADERLTRDVWDSVYLQGKKVGYNRTRTYEFTENGRKLLRLEVESVIRIGRFNDAAEQRMTMRSVETPDGQVVRFETIAEQGPTPDRTVGEVQGDTMLLTVTTAGKTSTSQMPWNKDIGGFLAQEQELALRPMRPGEVRRFKSLVPILNQVADVTLTGGDVEAVDVLGTKLDLQRIDAQVALPGLTLPVKMWVDRAGETIKNSTELMQQDTYRTTKEVALGEIEAVDFDLGMETLVKLDPPPTRGHQARRARYQVRLEGGDPSEVFVHCRTQQVRKIDDHTAEVTVLADDPDAPPPTGGPLPADAPPGDDELAANNLIQCDDAKVVELAEEAAGGETDPLLIAARLEGFVQRTIDKKNYSTAFATAADVARTREGDCTEHSVLLAALLRARGVPARVAMGLVYVPQSQALAYHMWTEAYVNSRWMPLDGTLGRGGIGAAHLKLGQSSLAGASAYSSLLPVAQVLGRLHVDVLEEE
jgi:hypothetical protein